MSNGDFKSAANELLADMLLSIQRLEQKAIAGFHPVPLTLSEVHLIEVVGKSSETSMGEIAKQLRITLPTLTAALDRLVGKGMMLRNRNATDRRRVAVLLTEAGRLAYRRHKEFHDSMVEDVFALEGVKMPVLLESMALLRDFLKKRIEEMDTGAN
jgi:DNA-binding MarR family transcriptional regulator